MPLSTKILKKIEIKGSYLYEATPFSLMRGKNIPYLHDGCLEEKASKKAQALLKEAHEKAQKIQAAAEKTLREAEEIREAARRRGEEKGYQEGAARFAGERERFLAEVKEKQLQAAKELFLLRQRCREKIWDAERQLVELSTRIAETLLNEQLNMDPERITSIVREAMAHLMDVSPSQKVKLYLHPADKSYCRAYLPVLQKEMLPGAAIDIFSDETLSRGSCRLETEEGQVELLIDKELEHLRNALRTMVEREKEANESFHQPEKV